MGKLEKVNLFDSVKALIYLITSLLFISCAQRVHRIGYSVKKSERWDCDLPIKKVMAPDTLYKKIGEIQFKECGNSKIRSKEDVITAIKKDGCAIDAEFAFIKQEKDNENVCYQCNAVYYVKKAQSVPSFDYKNSDKGDKPQQVDVAIAGIVTGLAFIAGFLIWKIYLGL